MSWGNVMNYKELSRELNKKVENMTDEEFFQSLIDAGFELEEVCPVKKDKPE